MGPILTCVVVFVGLLFYMLARPKTRRPNPLKLSQHKLRQSGLEGKQAADSKGRTVKELNVIFQFNGHDFDAFETLGVAAGSNPESVKVAYEKAKSQSDPAAHEFLTYAYNSILKSRQ
jgi:hypothetical protein